MVDYRAGQLPAEPAGLVGAGLRQRAGRQTLMGDYLVPAGFVGLDENGTVIGTTEAEAVMPAQ